MEMEKFCLKWNEFESNVRESFKALRYEGRLFDVTLATDDGSCIQAHKMILSAGSHFFADIFLKSNHTDILIYLKGISSAELEHVTDFLYNGEVFVSHEELPKFFVTAQELRIKGLEGNLNGTEQNVSEKQMPSYEDRKYFEEEIAVENVEIFRPKSGIVSSEKLTESFDTNEYTLDEVHEEDTANNTNIDLQIEQMMERVEGLWKCTVCGQTSSYKSHIKEHAERHLNGVSHGCHICRKIFSARDNLRVHISQTHSKVLSCNVCGKSGMNKRAYRDHRKTH